MTDIKENLFGLNTNLTLRQVELIEIFIESNYIPKEDHEKIIERSNFLKVGYDSLNHDFLKLKKENEMLKFQLDSSDQSVEFYKMFANNKPNKK